MRNFGDSTLYKTGERSHLACLCMSAKQTPLSLKSLDCRTSKTPSLASLAAIDLIYLVTCWGVMLAIYGWPSRTRTTALHI